MHPEARKVVTGDNVSQKSLAENLSEGIKLGETVDFASTQQWLVWIELPAPFPHFISQTHLTKVAMHLRYSTLSSKTANNACGFNDSRASNLHVRVWLEGLQLGTSIPCR
jgi:hypothetical protein